jgi:phage anti-repressor protein
MDGYMTQFGQSTEPKTEVVKDPLATIELCVTDAIRMIQKNERGRQGRYRFVLIQKTHKQ